MKASSVLLVATKAVDPCAGTTAVDDEAGNSDELDDAPPYAA